MKAGWPTTLFVSVLLTCPVKGQEGESANEGNRRTAPNQSAVIDDPAASDTSLSAEVTAEPPPESIDGSDAGAREDEPAPRYHGKTRRARADRRPDGAATFSVMQSTPWYRTGLGALAIVLVLIGGLVWALRRWMPAARGSDNHILRVVGRASLSPKHSIALIRVGRRFVMVGMSADRVNALCEVSDPDEVAELSVRTGASGARDVNGFDRLLLEEAADYREALSDGGKEAGSTAARTVRTRQPLSDLLRRLRMLQAR